jgi:transposase-like protein
MTTVTVLAGPERRRRWTTAEKLRIVEESLSSGLSVVEFARQRDLHPNLVHSWRRQAGELPAHGSAARFVPVAVAAPSSGDAGERCGRRLDAGSGAAQWACPAAAGLYSRTRRSDRRCTGRRPAMIPMPAGTQIWVACGATDMRKGFDGLAMLAQEVVKKSPYCGHLFVFRGKRAD